MEEEIKLEVAKNVDTKDIELALQTDKKVDEAVVEKSLNYDALTPEEKAGLRLMRNPASYYLSV